MKTDDFYAVILSGGSGERFWPLSTPDRPKQFLSVFGGKSLIRQSVDRLAGLVPPERILVVTADALVPATRRELPDLPRANIVGEPCRRDTAAAVATACGLAERLGGEDAVVAILTADHLMGNVPAFRRMLSDAARAAARTDAIVTMGVTPDYPATGFGYIQTGPLVDVGTKTPFHRARRFVEKPDEATARRYLKSGRFVWNAGMFVWRVKSMKTALREASDELIGLEMAVANRRRPVSKTLAALYPPLPRISVDYAVMEKARNILVASGDFGWDDVGSFAAFDKYFPHDSRGNVREGPCTVVEADGNICVARSARISLLGVKNLVVVTTPDSVLVADKSRLTDMKKLFKR